jgi:valacyclovir hydrolase
MAWFEQGNAKIYYEESGAGEPLLLLPGWAGSIEELAGLRYALASNFRVIAADLPGSGKSGPQPRTYTTGYYEEDAQIFLDMLESLGATPAHLVGFSDGGEYALLMAALQPAAVRSLVTWGSAGSLGNNLQMADAMATLIDAPIPPMAEFAEYMKAVYGENNARVMTQTAGATFRAIIEAGGDISRSRASEITASALLITGEHDFLATPGLVADMANAMQRAEFMEAEGASHAIHHEQPDWLLETVTDWLARTPSGAR